MQQRLSQCVLAGRDIARPVSTSFSQDRQIRCYDWTSTHASFENWQTEAFPPGQVDQRIYMTVKPIQHDIVNSREMEESIVQMRMLVDSADQRLHVPSKTTNEQQPGRMKLLPYLIEGIQNQRVLLTGLKRTGNQKERPVFQLQQGG